MLRAAGIDDLEARKAVRSKQEGVYERAVKEAKAVVTGDLLL